jgi:hypothetical protein
MEPKSLFGGETPELNGRGKAQPVEFADPAASATHQT